MKLTVEGEGNGGEICGQKALNYIIEVYGFELCFYQVFTQHCTLRLALVCTGTVLARIVRIRDILFNE